VRQAGTVAAGRTVGPVRATLAALAASLVGIGLARFAYTPLLPALIGAGWFTAPAAAYLGAANLLGYLAGALLGRRFAARLPAATVLRAMMLLATVAFFACAAPVSFAWFFVWRFASGLAGGALMGLAAPTVLLHVPPGRRGLAGGVIFTGVGLGIVASGSLMPPLLRLGLAEAWCGLGLLSLLLTLAAWSSWPADATLARPIATADPAGVPSGLILPGLYGGYALNALGLVPHMVFLVDFIARGLGQGLDAGALYWVVFGLGATLGPVAFGTVADRIGFAPTLRLAFVVQALAILVPALAQGTMSLLLSSLIVGAFVPGIVPVVLGRVQELVPPVGHAQRIAWSRATTGFALGQALGAYGFSYLFARGGGYTLLFTLGAAALVLALALELAVAAVAGRTGPR
jgi:predicted MFS family arabinose efflux permease